MCPRQGPLATGSIKALPIACSADAVTGGARKNTASQTITDFFIISFIISH